jgi:hypothetical protein
MVTYTIESADPQKHLQHGLVNPANVSLLYQFFIHPNVERQNEIKHCLEKNQANPFITDIYLLGERLYTLEELGLSSEMKITQIVIGHRLQYSDIFKYAHQENIQGWLIACNADICFDTTLQNLIMFRSDERLMFSQLRWEYNGKDITAAKMFGPRADSQDCWMWHNKNTPHLSTYEKLFRFQLGQAGCDNHLAHLFQTLGFTQLNIPTYIRALHYHTTQIRNYTQADAVQPPYCQIVPHGLTNPFAEQPSWNDNDNLRKYIEDKLYAGQPFIIPRVAGIENIVVFHKKMSERHQQVMKNNAGVQIGNDKSLHLYCKEYTKAFKNCEIYTGWSKRDNVYTTGVGASQDWIEYNICKGKPMVWARALDAFNYIHSNPWTTALRGKRILVISAFTESIKEKIGKAIYPVELFPDCSFVFLQPLQLQGENFSREWYIEYDKWFINMDTYKDSYDVALVSAGGMGNIICNHIFDSHKKSAIYIGGVISTYFGVYNQRMLTENKYAVTAYLNQHWSRPKVSERPAGFKGIEGGCYF